MKLIWVVNPQRKKATIYAPDFEQPIHLKGDVAIAGLVVLPKFELPLRDLFNDVPA